MSGIAASYPQNRPAIMSMIRSLRPSSVVEIGIGTGYYGEMIRRDLPGVRLEGVETWEAYRNRRWDAYDEVRIGDALEESFEPRDLFLAVDVLEHMWKEEALGLLRRLPGPVLVSIPWHYPQEADENPRQAHVSTWGRGDLAGFRIRADMSNHLSMILLLDGPAEERP